jgi:hypothetical protein
MTEVYQHGYTVCIKPDSNRQPGQEVLVPDLVTLRSSLVVSTEQHDVPLKAREFALEQVIVCDGKLKETVWEGPSAVSMRTVCILGYGGNKQF